MEREQIQHIYIRICRDSGFQLEWDRAAHLTAAAIGISTWGVWLAFPSLDRMKAIALGTDPIIERQIKG